MKKLLEKRAELQDEMDVILNTAETENRAMTEDEVKRFDAIEAEIRAIDVTLEKKDTARKTENRANTEEKTVEERAAAEEKAFCEFVLNAVENRAGEVQLTQGLNGTIVPTTIANRIIKAVKAKVPFFNYADVYETKGKLSIPVYGEDGTTFIKADYVDEDKDLVDNVGKFTTVDLEGYVIGALSLVSNKLKNNTDIDVSGFIVRQVAEAISDKLMKEFTAGSTKIKGILVAKNTVTAGAAAAVTIDDLIGLKQKLPQQYREKGVWIMHPDTYTAILKLKDGNSQPYFKAGEPIFNRPVIESEDMPAMKTGQKAIVYADLSGYAIKGTQGIEVQVLRERFAPKNMLGILGFAEYDGKIADEQKIAVLTMA